MRPAGFASVGPARLAVHGLLGLAEPGRRHDPGLNRTRHGSGQGAPARPDPEKES